MDHIEGSISAQNNVIEQSYKLILHPSQTFKVTAVWADSFSPIAQEMLCQSYQLNYTQISNSYKLCN